MSSDRLFIIFAGLAILWFAWSGYKRGFFVSTYDVIVLGALIVGGWWAVSRGTLGLLPALGLKNTISVAVGFLVVALLADRLRALGAMILRSRLRLLLRDHPTLDYVDHIAGIVPGAARGILYSAIAAILLVGFAILQSLPPDVVALYRVAVADPAMASALSVGQAGAIGQSRDVEVSSVSPDGVTAGPPDPVQPGPIAGSTDDSAAEAQMLTMINLTRLQVGVAPLAADGRLAAIARQHSEEMFRLGYFSHLSPELGSPRDRLRLAGLDYRQFAENVAYAPSVEAAYRGLLASPAHRDNIVWGGFRRVGIGVFALGAHGVMVTQDYAD